MLKLEIFGSKPSLFLCFLQDNPGFASDKRKNLKLENRYNPRKRHSGTKEGCHFSLPILLIINYEQMVYLDVFSAVNSVFLMALLFIPLPRVSIV